VVWVLMPSSSPSSCDPSRRCTICRQTATAATDATATGGGRGGGGGDLGELLICRGA